MMTYKKASQLHYIMIAIRHTRNRIAKTELKYSNAIHGIDYSREKVQTSPNNNNIADRYLDELAKEQALLEMQLVTMQRRRNEIIEWIDTLDGTEIQEIATMRYVDDMTLSEIGREMGYSASSVKRKLDRFWRNIERAR